MWGSTVFALTQPPDLFSGAESYFLRAQLVSRGVPLGRQKLIAFLYSLLSRKHPVPESCEPTCALQSASGGDPWPARSLGRQACSLLG